MQLSGGRREATRRAGVAGRRSTGPKLHDHLLLGLHQLQQHRFTTISLRFGIRERGRVLGFRGLGYRGVGFWVQGLIRGLGLFVKGSSAAKVPMIWGWWVPGVALQGLILL